MFVLSVKITHFLKENMTSHEYFKALSEEDAGAVAERSVQYSNDIMKLAERKGGTPASKFAAMISYFSVDFAVAEKRISDLEEQVKLLLNKKEG